MKELENNIKGSLDNIEGNLKGSLDNIEGNLKGSILNIETNIVDNTNEKIDTTNEKIDTTNEKIDITNEKIDLQTQEIISSISSENNNNILQNIYRSINDLKSEVDYTSGWSNLLPNFTGKECEALAALSAFDEDLIPGPHLEIYGVDLQFNDSELESANTFSAFYCAGKRSIYYAGNRYRSSIYNPIAKKLIHMGYWYNSFKLEKGQRIDNPNNPRIPDDDPSKSLVNPNDDYIHNIGGWITHSDGGRDILYDWYYTSEPDGQSFNLDSDLLVFKRETFNDIVRSYSQAKLMKYNASLIISKRYWSSFDGEVFDINKYNTDYNNDIPQQMYGKVYKILEGETNTYIEFNPHVTFNQSQGYPDPRIFINGELYNSVKYDPTNMIITIDNQTDEFVRKIRIDPSYSKIYFTHDPSDPEKIYEFDGSKSILPYIFTKVLAFSLPAAGSLYYSNTTDSLAYYIDRGSNLLSGMWVHDTNNKDVISVQESFTIFPDIFLYGVLDFDIYEDIPVNPLKFTDDFMALAEDTINVNLRTPRSQYLNLKIYKDRNASDLFVEYLQVPRISYSPNEELVYKTADNIYINLSINLDYKSTTLKITYPRKYTDNTYTDYDYKYIILSRKIRFSGNVVPVFQQGYIDKNKTINWPTDIPQLNKFNFTLREN